MKWRSPWGFLVRDSKAVEGFRSPRRFTTAYAAGEPAKGVRRGVANGGRSTALLLFRGWMQPEFAGLKIDLGPASVQEVRPDNPAIKALVVFRPHAEVFELNRQVGELGPGQIQPAHDEPI